MEAGTLGGLKVSSADRLGKVCVPPAPKVGLKSHPPTDWGSEPKQFVHYVLFCLLMLRLNVRVNNFQSFRDNLLSSWMEPVLSIG